MTREVEVTIKPDGSSLAVCIYNSGILEMGARVRRESDDVTEEILYQVATIHEDMVSQRDELNNYCSALTHAAINHGASKALRDIIDNGPAASLAELKAQAIEQFADQWNYEIGGDNQFIGYAYSHADRIRQEAQCNN